MKTDPGPKMSDQDMKTLLRLLSTEALALAERAEEISNICQRWLMVKEQ